jgi:hypothetical protein
MKIIFILSAILLIVTASVSAQFTDKSELETINKDYLGLKPVDKPFSLIDFSRLYWTHSYSMTFFSGAGSSGSVGMYTGNVFYEITPNLSLNMNIGIAHNPGSLFDRTQNTNAVFLPGGRLDYRPSENFHISMGFNTYSGNSGLYPYNYYHSPYWWKY